MSPEEIVQRSFTTSFRGYSEAEVRAFLKRVSEEIVTTRDREAELLRTVDSLEEQLRSPRPLNEPEMLDALGAETTRLLRSAREAADEIKAKSEERGAQILAEAQAEGDRIRGEAEELASSRTEEAERRATELVVDAEARAAEIVSTTEVHSDEQRARAEREAADQIESARHQGREMLDEAKATRERVLADLFRRRSLLQAQIDELRAGRDNLLDAYRVVKRTFLEATEALARVEQRVAAERVARDNDAQQSDELADELARELPGESSDEEVAVAESAWPVETGGDAGEATDPSLADVDSLFARIRAGQTEPIVEPAAEGDPQPETVEVQPEAAAAPPESGEAVATESEPADAAEEPAVPTDSRAAWRAKRSDVLVPLHVALAKRAKRTAQDDQNALLDAVRRHKGRPTADQVLVPESDLLAAWAGVVQDAIDGAYGAGRAAVGSEPVRADDAMVGEAAATIVMPVRERIAAAIDTGDDGDTGGLVERVGARFREWRNQSLEVALFDVLAAAWSRGVYDGSPDGAVLRWIPLVEGRCADCDDNGLEPTVKGSSFPTGQAHPPAHPGCRCLLAPAT